MPFTLERFIALRPYAYHLTSPKNLPRLLKSRELISASALLKAANLANEIQVRRIGHKVVKIGDETAVIRDQDPLHPGNMEITGGWNFARLLEHLNEFIFFWPGKEEKPIDYGVRHFERYKDEKPTILRMSTAELIEHNGENLPYFSKVNSGAPRYSWGKASPRGPETFLRSTDAEWDAPRVVELTYRHSVKLPPNFKVGAFKRGKWEKQD